jgi:signal transduction histidine kinase
LLPARGFGRQAVALGLETLDVAKIHDKALATLESSGNRDGIIERAAFFFTEAITPIERTHRAALRANIRLSQLKKRLAQRTADLGALNRSLKKSVAQRKTAEEALKKRGDHCKTLLKESLALQKQLRRMTHHILAAREDKRKEISRNLQDEIAQTLLAINVRLLTLRKEAAIDADGLQKGIVNTQRLVDMSVKTIEEFAREFGKHHEA